ncbi:hypothetical protein, partial [Bradyrhizobium sp. STM 3809]|uniref:hypothetical protein n=1 Tax=Bradyrhizobium sp. STM 3809 TaxID=551936 RepID=UPI0011122B26
MSSNGQTQSAGMDAAREVANLVAAMDGMRDRNLWKLDDEVRYLRLYIERGIDDLQQAEDSLCELVKDGICLAINNMQDARLQFLEKKLEEAKNRSLPTEELLFEFLILIVVEVVIAQTMEIAAPFVLSAIMGK